MISQLILPFALLSTISASVLPISRRSPATIALKRNAGARYGQPQKRQVVSEPLADYFNGTDLQWFGEVEIGTPPQKFTAAFDTGSTFGVIPGVGCTTCGTKHLFDGSKSSTFINLNVNSTEVFATGAGVLPSDTESLNVTQVVDTISIAGLEAPNTTWYLVTGETEGFVAVPFDGIIGMGFAQNETVFSNILAQGGVDPVFSLYLTPEAVGDAELTLGGIDENHVKEPINYVSLNNASASYQLWVIDGNQIAVNGKTSSILSQPVPNIVVDSGTSNLAFPLNVTQAIYALISPNIQPVGTLGAFGIPCEQISGLPALIDIAFTSEDGTPFNLTIPSSELSVGPFPNNTSLCQTLINAQEFAVLGGSLLKHYYSIWDLGAARLGFTANGF